MCERFEGSRTNARQVSPPLGQSTVPLRHSCSLRIEPIASGFSLSTGILLVRQRPLYEQSLTPDAVVRITISDR